LRRWAKRPGTAYEKWLREVWLVPIGAALLFYSIARIALDLRKLK